MKGQAELNNARSSGQPTTALTQALLQRAEELTGNSRRITTRQLGTVSSQEVWTALLMRGDVQKHELFGFHEA